MWEGDGPPPLTVGTFGISGIKTAVLMHSRVKFFSWNFKICGNPRIRGEIACIKQSIPSNHLFFTDLQTSTNFDKIFDKLITLKTVLKGKSKVDLRWYINQSCCIKSLGIYFGNKHE